MKYGSFPDIIGKSFGKILVLNKLKHPKVLIKCECGYEKAVSKYDVYNGKIKSCGSKQCVARSKDLTNQKFSLLTVLGPAEEIKQIVGRCSQWQCQCECGNIIVVPSNQLNSGRTKSCGCAKGIWISEKNSLPIKERVENEIYSNYKDNAKDRNYCFDLTKEQFISFLYEECYYCGSPPLNSMTKLKITGSETHHFNGIDRVDNSIGYVLNNCVTCCKFCNHAKHNMSKDNFINLAKKIANKFQDL